MFPPPPQFYVNFENYSDSNFPGAKIFIDFYIHKSNILLNNPNLTDPPKPAQGKYTIFQQVHNTEVNIIRWNDIKLVWNMQKNYPKLHIFSLNTISIVWDSSTRTNTFSVWKLKYAWWIQEVFENEIPPTIVYVDSCKE